MADQLVHVTVQSSLAPTNYTVWFFNSAYPKARDPFSPAILAAYHRGATAEGALDYFETPTNLGLEDGATYPTIHSFTELAADASGGQRSPEDVVLVNPSTRQDYPWIGVADPG